MGRGFPSRDFREIHEVLDLFRFRVKKEKKEIKGQRGTLDKKVIRDQRGFREPWVFKDLLG